MSTSGAGSTLGLRIHLRGAPAAGGSEAPSPVAAGPASPLQPERREVRLDRSSRPRSLQASSPFAGPHPARPGLRGPEGLPGSVSAGGSASPGAARGLASPSCTSAPPLPAGGSGSGLRRSARCCRGAGGVRGCRRPVQSRRMSWMRKEVSGLAWVASPASPGRGSAVLSIPSTGRLSPRRPGSGPAAAPAAAAPLSLSAARARL